MYGLFRWRRSAAESDLSWNTAPLMAETTNARLAQFLTMLTVVEYCGGFASLSSLYGTLDSILFIVVCSHKNSSSPPHSILILGNHIPVRNIDRKFHHGRFTLVLEVKLGLSNITCALCQFPISYLLGNSGVVHAGKVSRLPEMPRPQDGI